MLWTIKSESRESPENFISSLSVILLFSDLDIPTFAIEELIFTCTYLLGDT